MGKRDVAVWDGVHHANSNRTDKQFCVRCGKLIKADGVSLELNCHTGRYRSENDPSFPAHESQGWFTFGPDCAQATLHEQRL